MTNGEKFKKVFGVDQCQWMIKNRLVSIDSNGKCSEPGCSHCMADDIWWDMEYKSPISEADWHCRKCGDCAYLDLKHKTTIGFVCNRPNHWWRSATANKKYKHAKACKDFLERM